MDASFHPMILVAATPETYTVVERALDGIGQLVPVFSGEEAARRIEGVDLLICTMRFDESRMLDLLSLAMRRFPGVPCICCRLEASDLPAASLRAAFTAAGNLGAAGFVDFPRVQSERGEAAALAELRSTVLAQLRGRRRPDLERRPRA